MASLSLKLYSCRSYPAGPYEKGTYCISSIERGFILATSEKEAEEVVRKKFNLGEKTKVKCSAIRRCKRNQVKAFAVIDHYNRLKKYLDNQREILLKWLGQAMLDYELHEKSKEENDRSLEWWQLFGADMLEVCKNEFPLHTLRKQ